MHHPGNVMPRECGWLSQGPSFRGDAQASSPESIIPGYGYGFRARSFPPTRSCASADSYPAKLAQRA
jgi:hypothetical protein